MTYHVYVWDGVVTNRQTCVVTADGVGGVSGGGGSGGGGKEDAREREVFDKQMNKSN